MKEEEETAYSQEEEISLHELYSVVKKKCRLIIIVFLVAVVLTGVVSFMLPSVYRVSASLIPGWLERGKQGEIIYVDSARNILSSIKDGSYNGKIIESLGLPLEEHWDMEFVTKLAKESDVVYVHYDTKEPEVGKRIVEELLNQVKGFYSERIRLKRGIIDKSIELFKNKTLMLENQKTRIRTSKKKMQSNIEIVRNQKTRIRTDKKKIKSAIEVVANKKTRIRSAKKKIQSNMELEKEKFALLKDRQETLKKQIRGVEGNTKSIMQQRKALLEKGKDVRDAVALLLYSNTIQQNITYEDRLKTQVDENQLAQEFSKSSLKKLNFQLEDKDTELKDKDEEILRLNFQLEDKDTELKDKDEEILKLNLQLEDKDTELNDVDKKVMNVEQEIGKLKINKQQIEGIRIIKQPRVSFYPVKPKKALNVAVAGVASLFIGVFLAFFMEWIGKNGSSAKKD